MATDHDPSALEAPAGGVPRHASARERKARGLGPFLSDLKAEVRSQLSRAEVPGRVPQVAGPGPAGPGATAPDAPGTAYAEPAETYPAQPFAQRPDDAAALVAAALAEIEAAHREFETLRAEFDAAQEAGRRNILIAWVGAGAAAVLAAAALVLGFA